MVATIVGFLTIGLVVYLYQWTLWRFLKRILGILVRSSVLPGEPPLWMRRLGLVALGAVIAQGLLGGLTVKLMLPLAVSAAHATLAQLFFCTTVGLAVFTSRSWLEARPKFSEKGSLPLRYLCTAAVVTIFLQLILGATLRHSATWDQSLPTELVLAHVAGALVVVLTLGSTVLSVFRRYKGEKYLTGPAAIALSLLIVQLFLGLAAYLTRLASPNDPQPLNPMIGITVAHVACGALVFATTIVLTLRTFRLVVPSQSTVKLDSRTTGVVSI